MLCTCISLFLLATLLFPASFTDSKEAGCKEVALEAFLPDAAHRTGIATIICPGGSYFWLDYDNEGVEVAKWLQSKGIAAYVLRYRTGGVGAFLFHSRVEERNPYRFPAMIQDLQQALQWVRLHATAQGVDPNRIGVMGFSAGGHLALLSGVFFETNYLADLGLEQTTSLRPNFVASIYPVVTFTQAPYVHKRSLRGLLGDEPTHMNRLKDSLSIEHRIHPQSPPVFIVNCKDDPIVPYQNSVLLDSALTAHRIPHRYRQYETGGHGFGSGTPKNAPLDFTWKEEFLLWLKETLPEPEISAQEISAPVYSYK